MLLAWLALGGSGCASRHQPGATTSLAIDVMAVAAEQRRAEAHRGTPVGAHAARAEQRLATAGEAGGGDGDGN